MADQLASKGNSPKAKPAKVRHRNQHPFLYLLGALVLAFGISFYTESGNTIASLSGKTMGTHWVVRSKDPLDEALQLKIQEELNRFELIFSTWIPDSEINKLSELSNQSVNRAIEVSIEMHEVLSLGKEVSALSQGYFDMTVGDLVKTWGFGDSEAIQRLPEASKLASQLTKGMNAIDLTQNRTMTFSHSVALDASAIAKGAAVDAIVNLLKEQGFDNYLVDIGGELAYRHGARKRPWVLGIQHPIQWAEQYLVFAPSKPEYSLATSGSYFQNQKIDDLEFTHIIDPHSGKAVSHTLVSVSVMADTTARADAWATALFAAGLDKGIAIAEQQGITALFLTYEPSSNTLSSNQTKTWKNHIHE